MALKTEQIGTHNKGPYRGNRAHQWLKNQLARKRRRLERALLEDAPRGNRELYRYWWH